MRCGRGRAAFNARADFLRGISKRTGERQLPIAVERFEGFDQARRVLALLHGPHAEHQLLTRHAGIRQRRNAVMHHRDPGRVDAQQVHNLAAGELRNRDNGVRAGRRIARLRGEPGAKLGVEYSPVITNRS